MGCGGRNTAVTNSGHQSLGAGERGQKRGWRLMFSDGDPLPAVKLGLDLLSSSALPQRPREENDVSALALTLWFGL